MAKSPTGKGDYTAVLQYLHRLQLSIPKDRRLIATERDEATVCLSRLCAVLLPAQNRIASKAVREDDDEDVVRGHA